MDKIIDVPALNHIIKLTDRKNIIISGIKKINSFDEKEFDLDSVMGSIIIKGSNLEMIKLPLWLVRYNWRKRINKRPD